MRYTRIDQDLEVVTPILGISTTNSEKRNYFVHSSKLASDVAGAI